MSENRFEGGLDLDDSFGADYVAKKQEPEPEGWVMDRGERVRPAQEILRRGPLSEQSQYLQNQYQNVFNHGQGFSNATQYLAGTGGSGLSPYMTSGYSSNQTVASKLIVEKRWEFDYAQDMYRVIVTRADGSREVFFAADRREVDSIQ